MTNRPSKLPRSPRAEPPTESTFKSARELDCREPLLTPRDAANFLRLSLSWLAKSRMRGDGPPFVKLGRAIRYSEGALMQWMHSRQRLSTSDR
jgi:predicted DNA-binding transcriptional regulator AlpA